MITCSYCGKPTQAGMAQCQSCGRPITNMANSGGNTKATSGQPALPAWLETLRAGDQSTPSSLGGNGASDLSADDFADESLLPGWMQADANDAGDNHPSDSFQLRRPASMSAPNTDSTFIPTQGMSASSFIDEKFLPSWLQDKSGAASNAPGEHVSASSLVQQDALPEWITSASPLPSNQTSQANQAQPVSLYGQQANQARPVEGIAGNDLIDQQAVPQWMAQHNASVATPGQTGFAASSLIDKDVLPSWMREQGGQPALPTSPTPYTQSSYEQAANYPMPFGQMQAQSQSPTQQPMAQNQMPSQIQGQQGQQTPSSQQQQPIPTNTSLSASSFIDVNALPDWLRAPDNARPNTTPPASPMQPNWGEQQRQGQGNVGTPPRPEYVRVPSRPRGEPGSYEDSAVAANAFASMLGVASATPFSPGQQPRNVVPGQESVQSQPFPNMPVGSQGSGAGMFTPNVPPAPSSATWDASAAQMASGVYQGYAGQGGQQPTQGVPPNSSASPSMPNTPTAAYQNGYPMNAMPGMVPPPSPPMNGAGGMQQGTQGYGNRGIGDSENGAGQSKASGKPAKRGFLSTILDWFSR